MRRIIKRLLVLGIFFFAVSPAFAQKAETIAVFPVNLPIAGSSYTLCPNILELISGDVANSFNKNSQMTAIDPNSADKIIKSQGLTKKYNKLLLDYRTSYTVDYDVTSLLAKKIGATKILLVSGGFDFQTMMMKRSWLYMFDIPTGRPLVPSYRLDVVLSLIDPQSGTIIWENTYKKDVEAADFALSSQYFAENIISSEKIKRFSNDLSGKAVLAISTALFSPESTEVSSNIVDQRESSQTGGITTKDGMVTKDGHSLYNNDYLLRKRKDNFKKWAKEDLIVK